MIQEITMEFTAEFFDASSAAWMANKIKKPNATYAYKCSFIGIDKTPCCAPRHKLTTVCWRHRGSLKQNKVVDVTQLTTQKHGSAALTA